VLQTAHWTLDAPRMYMSSVRQPPHSSCAISVPAGGTGVTPLHRAQRTLAAPWGGQAPRCTEAICIARLRVEQQRAAAGTY